MQKGSQLKRPFYFLLDEFGNLPKFNDFDKVISACGGRNIWFLLILQSYAQLDHIYKKEIGIVDGHDSSSYFWIMPVRVIDPSDKDAFDNIAEMSSSEISIEENIFST